MYVKMPKCASTAVLDWFLAHGAGRHSFRPSWYPGTMAHRIQSVARAMDLYPDYFTFTFVRNPYHRFLSTYRHATRLAVQRAPLIAGHPASYGSPREFAELCREVLADWRRLWGARASAFLRDNGGRRYGPLGIALRHLRFVVDHARPQVDFLPDCNPERLFGHPRGHARPLSFIGAVETMDADFRRVQETLGLPRLPLAIRNPSEPASGPHGCRAPDRGTCRLVEEIYAADFACTGYPTGAGAAAAPPSRSRRPLPVPRRTRRPPAATRARRGLFTLASLEIGLEARIIGTHTLCNLLAPLSRLRRRLA